MLAGGGLLGISDGFGALSLTNGLGVPGMSDKSMAVTHTKGLTSEHLTRNSLTSIGTNASSTTVVPSVPFTQGIGQANGLPFGWMSIADPEGRMFYFNNLTGAAQWNLPLIS